MRRIIVFGAVWIGLSICCAALLLAASDPPAPVAGKVVDQNGQGVAKASVAIGGEKATTGKGGGFTIKGLADGAYEATVQAGDATSRVQVQVAGSKLEPSVLRIEIQPQLEKAEGKVVDRDGKGLANATVDFEGKSVRTNKQGKFVFEGAAKKYEVTVTLGEKTVGPISVTLTNGKLNPSELVIQ